MRKLLLIAITLFLAGCLQPSSGGSSAAKYVAAPEPEPTATPEPEVSPTPTPTPESIPETVSEIASALHGKFIMQADLTHSIEFQGSQIRYEGTANSTKHVQTVSSAPGNIQRNWQCTWQADFIEVKDFGQPSKSVMMTVTATNALVNVVGSITNCPYSSSTNFKIRFVSETCFEAQFPLATEQLTFCHE